MTEPQASKTRASAAKSAATEEEQTVETPTIQVTKTKRKKKYSKGLKDVQKFERGISKASKRIADAASSGVNSYRKRSSKSARKKRDGAIRDVLENASIATGKAISKSARVPYDLARAVNTKPVWKTAKPLVKAAFAPFS